eukprot:tig00000629_g2671.t1
MTEPAEEGGRPALLSGLGAPRASFLPPAPAPPSPPLPAVGVRAPDPPSPAPAAGAGREPAVLAFDAEGPEPPSLPGEAVGPLTERARPASRASRGVTIAPSAKA